MAGLLSEDARESSAAFRATTGIHVVWEMAKPTIFDEAENAL
jgi:hypothetical protein